MASYPLYIITYDRGESWDDSTKKKPFHWAFFLQTGSDPGEGLEFQLHGMPGAFYYSGGEAVNPESSDAKNQELEIGSVPVDKYARFTQLLANVPIIIDESSKWNCQDWSLEALDRFRREGFIEEQYQNNVIKYWLREDK
ncbi:hypothetical protein BU24DRAFT_488487 [Aaosphaeria arxii CBS 175.79]|uniref:Uncharacterized protein n=1 Tax=Aaosphaeria arxii CBS 175.79 TaxID=1450172 RepID=A0A6A5Y9Y0_9PLEO|nr:uncharacterized protein BU24DRAFT_488487 [Aaosphaeria arxii CBS 175.79]KAF2022238.1 hypothetical protein BU24DRAFT_488487 [Aaosphaeria arxii CBS 175.79]